jgi:hypothetical protein
MRLLGEATSDRARHRAHRPREHPRGAGGRPPSVSVGYGGGDEVVASSASSARPGWTTPARWRRCAPSRATSAASWRSPEWRPICTSGHATTGVARDATPDEIKRPTAAREGAAPRRQPGPGDAGPLQGDHRGLRGALRPGQARAVRPRRRPVRGAGSATAGFAGFGFGDIMDAFFGGAGPARAAVPAPRGQDALIRIEVDLAEATFGATARSRSTPPWSATTCQGEGTAPGTHPETCECARVAARSSTCSARSWAR